MTGLPRAHRHPGRRDSTWFPVWLVFPALVGLPEQGLASAVVLVAAVLLVGLLSWSMGWGAADPRRETSFAAGWIVAWLASLGVFLASTSFSGSGDAALLLGGLLPAALGLRLAWSFRRRLPKLTNPTSAKLVPFVNTAILFAVVAGLILLGHEPRGLLLVAGSIAALSWVLAVRGRGRARGEG